MRDRQDIDGSLNATAANGGTATVNVSINKQFHAVPTASADQTSLATARQMLASLPQDIVPGPATLPLGSRMPWQPNRLFVGRVDELKTLAATIKDGGAALIGQAPVIAGLGGIGKTQLAAELALRYGTFFAGGVFWLSFADAAGIPAEIAACGLGLGLHADFANLPIETQVALVSSRWQDGLPRLLVFDNCEDPALFEAWCPRSGDCRVVLTSRRADWPVDLGVTPLPLGTLPRTESIALLRRFRPDLAAAEPVLNDIAHELGDLPLALHLAGSYLKRYQRIAAGQPEVYLDALRQPAPLNHPSLTVGGRNPTGHEQHIARTFQLGLDRLDPNDSVDALALAALIHAAHLAPGVAVPVWLLGRILDIDPADKTAECRLADALTRLADLGLIETEAGAPVLHRLVAAFARDYDQEAKGRCRVEVVVATTAAEQNRTGLPGPLLAWQPHLHHVAHIAAAQGAEGAGLLMNELGYHLRMVADYTGAREAYERALAIEEAASSQNIATCVNNLGRVFSDFGDIAAAQKAYQRALTIDEARYGPNHPEVATDVNNLAMAFKALGDLPAARKACERALAIDKAAFGPNHPKIAIRINNLGTVLHDLGDHSAARKAYERALAIDETAFGPDHPNIAIRLNNLGLVLKDLGDIPAARQAFERAGDIFLRTLGPDHPHTRIAQRALAALPPSPPQ